MSRKIDKEKWAKELASKTPETHAEVMQKLGISPKEDKKWHKEHGGKPADFSRLAKKTNLSEKLIQYIYRKEKLWKTQ